MGIRAQDSGNEAVKSDVGLTGLEETESGTDLSTDSLKLIDPATEKKLVRKLDLRLVPVLAVMYLLNILAKSNLGNAKTAPDKDGGSRGMPYDLNFGPGQYNIILAIYFLPHVLSAPFLGYLGKKYGPNRAMPVMMFLFGLITMLTAWTTNFSSMFAIRWFLGLSEAAFLPLLVYYLTTFYRRSELGRRLAILHAAQNIASAFVGLLAYGTFRIEPHKGGLPYSWSYLFVIEGAAAVIFSFFAFWYLPHSAGKASFLTTEEREVAVRRMQLDSSAVVDEPFVFRDAVKILKHPTTYVILALEICLGVPLQSIQLFLPSIVKRLGYSSVKTNLYTVAPSVTGAAMLLLLAFSSDLTRRRWPFIAIGYAFPFIGFVIYAALPDVHLHSPYLPAAYFATFVMTWGIAPSTLLDVWYNNNIAHEGRRLLLTSLGVPLSNLMGVVAANIFQDKDAPKYAPALVTAAAFAGTGALLSCALGGWMMWDNARRDRREGTRRDPRTIPTEELRDGPDGAAFRWYW